MNTITVAAPSRRTTRTLDTRPDADTSLAPASGPLVVAITGSPSEHAMSTAAALGVLDGLAAAGFQVRHLPVRELPADDLVRCRRDQPQTRAALDLIDRAHGVVVATPIYQTSFSGLLKTFLDLLGRDALAGKTVLPTATAGTLAHLLGIEYGLTPVLRALGATCTKGLFLLENAFERPVPDGPGCRLRPDAVDRTRKAANDFAATMTSGARNT
ncbi:NAD(P)H-dependent oxidoreductase [Streptomyces sp. G-G2]|uniref:NAD(P)H-dependent oxidoreductase n=1 Tax=Streptomyces sp. G-G2 TaxID=3046201 RepID=UPI0024BA2EC5|nr:NAD(P)H-dependent oxidoreductase [Streptomyces sp. G-G2]MDJ0380117.1 NAD(P)H-dependent oxidoreductase [Streptomyces sp. G-G2]